jgi:hypothetical protein
VSVISKTKVPAFGPEIYRPYVYEKDENLKNFLLSKLINAEYASLKAPAFSSFSEKTLEQSLQTLCKTLESLTSSFTFFESGSNLSSDFISTTQPSTYQTPDNEVKIVNPSIPSPNGGEATEIHTNLKGKGKNIYSILRKFSTMDNNQPQTTAHNISYKQNKSNGKSVKDRKTHGNNNTVN